MARELSIGYLSTLYHTSFILRGSGQLEEIGINASWKLFPNGPAMMEAFEQEQLDLGYIACHRQ
jgi:NitT/TauT family transport system substrate-binding protein